MTKNLDKEGLSSIADNYQLFYVDLWGVVHNGVTLHLEAIKALKEINKKKKDYILLTNAPRPNHAVKSFLEKLGMEKEIRDHVFTSGEAALIYLKKNLIDKNFFHVGPPRDFDLFKDFEKMKIDNIEKSEYILCTGLFDDHNDDLNYYKEYVGAVDIFALNEKNERTTGIRLIEAFPKTIGGIPFAHASSNTINKISVSFAYRYWRNIATEEEKDSLESTLQDILKNSVIRQVQSQIPAVLRRLF